MSSRKEEILAKRAKLEALKRQREARQSQFSTSRSGDTEYASPIAVRGSTTRIEDRRSDIDDLVRNLIGEGRPGSTGPGSRGSRPTSVLSAAESNLSELTSPQYAPPPLTESSQHTISFQVLTTVAPTVIYDAPPSATKEVVTYSKQVQTTESWLSTGVGTDDIEVDVGGEVAVKPSDEELRERIRQLEDDIAVLQQSEQKVATDLTNGHKKEHKVRELDDTEKHQITSTEEFADFIERSTKVMERALDQDYDILADYGLGHTGGDEDSSGRKIKETIQFYSERWSKKRIVSDIHFSPKFPELVLASYTKNPSAPHDPNGLVQVWNVHLHDRPEYIFHAQSDVLTARFSPYHPNLIVGGAYSGQVLIWDTRAKAQSVLRSPLTGSGHSHPVYSVTVVGTQNANNIVSCSTDGLVCGWSMDMLANPLEVLELTSPSPGRNDDLAPTCMAFPHSDPTYFLVGTEEGGVYPCHRYDRAGAKAGVEPRISYRGHAAPIMSIDFHPVKGPVDFGDLVLSASLDWSVKLWKARPPAATATAVVPGAQAQVATPLMDFPREDVVYDAKWSPVKPGVFGLVDGAGSLEVWDLTVDAEVPVAKTQPTARAGATSLLTRSLNKMAWEEVDGRRIAVGGLDSTITIFEVGNELGGLENARSDEWSSMKKLISKAEGGSFGAGGPGNGVANGTS
ncbi:hypothetical protein H072_5216 [Dactylellina haptotyla CBS 200.50]|uniref:Dynein intermediate chain, cytosolic n=1 Tax=Dactylellina haptotyla (strain CBS 200.50) TaxID=1284197 RepID=S8C027_DACHA|nr:hypothetical protein H072_5216 [Dactylellina haptotyla CBS 200.50]